MGWVPGFAYDVFLSYARVDNATPQNDASLGWVSQFHRHLEVALSKRVGRLDAVKIWRDTREIPGNKLFDQTIQDAIEQSAIFVALASRGYRQSEYCRQELGRFYAHAQTDVFGLAAGDDYRIFNLQLQNLPRAERPSEFGRTEGFCFNDAQDAAEEGEPSAIGQETFQGQLRAVSRAIHGTLSRLTDRHAERRPPATTLPRRFSVFLAETSDSLRAVRRRATTELAECPELDVITNVPPPFALSEHDERVGAIVESVDLSVHLLDAVPGREIDGHERLCYPQHQAELATRRGRAQLIWVPKDLSTDGIDDAGYRTFLDALENGPRDRARYDFQRELPSAVPKQIFAKIEELKSRRVTPPDSASLAALLDTHFKDQLHALELSHYLIQHGVQPYINPQEDDPGRNLEVFTQRLKQADVLILFCGAVADEWLRARLGVALKIAIAEACPLRACAVYLAPPRSADTAPTLRLPLVPVEWMDHTRGFNHAAVAHLLDRARASGGFIAT